MRIQLTSVRLHLVVAVTLILSLVALVPARLMGQHRVDRTGDSVLVATGIAVQQLGQLRDAQVMFADGDSLAPVRALVLRPTSVSPRTIVLIDAGAVNADAVLAALNAATILAIRRANGDPSTRAVAIRIGQRALTARQRARSLEAQANAASAARIARRLPAAPRRVLAGVGEVAVVAVPVARLVAAR